MKKFSKLNYDQKLMRVIIIFSILLGIIVAIAYYLNQEKPGFSEVASSFLIGIIVFFASIFSCIIAFMRKDDKVLEDQSFPKNKHAL
jgi:RsiW-degrading membrane proteinase PrsW (M82 family)